MEIFSGFKKGVNLGGWLSQCGRNYNDRHYESFILEEDIEKIASWGLDHVRLPVDYNVIQNEDGRFWESGFSHIDRCVQWCRKFGLKMILDLHKAPGFTFDQHGLDFFYQKPLQEKFIKLWEELARRYAGFHDFIAFELLNEVTSRETAPLWNNIAGETIKAIRKISTDVKIIIGGIFNSSIYGLTLLDPPADKNIVFTFHCYSPLIFTHQTAHWVERMPNDLSMAYPETIGEFSKKSEDIFKENYFTDYEGCDMEQAIGPEYFEIKFRQAVQVSEKYNVPLYCGEFGVIDKADPESTLNWFKDINAAFEKYKIPRTVWTYKEMDFGLNGQHYEPVISEIIKYL